MSLLASVIGTAERINLPDPVTRAGINFLVGATRRKLVAENPDLAIFASSMGQHPVARNTDAANQQHYELPSEFFGYVLGPRRKYSSCLYPTGQESQAEAELVALEETMANADLHDGQRILELGCGWGSLTLTMAERFPKSRITAVSNSRPQRRYIVAEAMRRGLGNIEVITADMNGFSPEGHFDRVVSVEMFEHMSNWTALLQRVRSWLKADGLLFIHIFTHRTAPYRFDENDDADWIAHHFFTGGIMPSHDLIKQFPELFSVQREWQWNGRHYERTALHWLDNFDAHGDRIDPILRQVYGDQAPLWRRRWRLFFLATAGLFGHANGTEWGVSHFRLRPTAAS